MFDRRTPGAEIWGDRTPGGDGIDMMILIEKDKALEDESESGEIFGQGILIGSLEGIYDEDGTLVGNIHGLRPCNLEMTSILNQISY
jgi:hypothetical protein